jgi:hypothetical protein
MLSNGSTSVSAASAGAGNDHGSCAFPALFSAKAWFDTLHAPCSDVGVREAQDEQWKFWPQPCGEQLQVLLPERFQSGGEWTLFHADGRSVRDGYYGVGEQQLLDLSGVTAGTYHVKVRSGAHRYFRTLMVE